MSEENEKKEVEQPDIPGSLKGIGDRLDKMDADFCSTYPELCAQVEKLEKAIPDTIEPGSELWTKTRSADLAHALFDDCPECTPVRDAVLAARGKRLADVEPEAKVDVEEAKVDAETAKVEDVEAKVDEETAKVEEPEAVDSLETEKRTSGGYFPGAVWDEDRELYVEQ